MATGQQFLNKLHSKDIISDTDLHMIQNFMKRWGTDSVEALTETHILNESELADFWAKEYGIERFFEQALQGHIDPLFDSVGYSDCKIDKLLPVRIHAVNSPKYLIFCNPTSDKVEKYQYVLEKGFKVGVMEFSVLDRLIDNLYLQSES